MFSGKSERLLDRLAAARAAGLACVAFKHASDDRYHSDQIVTHGGRRGEALGVGSASGMLELAGGARVVVVDEAQFFAIDLVEVCRRWVGEGRTVVIAGLDLDAWGKPFGPMPYLGELADTVTRTCGVCAQCGRPADRTQRVTPIEGPRMVGGPESYEPRCRDCFKPPPLELRR